MEHPLYKYMKAKYAQSFLRNGTLRIGTLYSYRDIERLGPEVGDAEEGLKQVVKDGFTILDTSAPETIPGFLRSKIRIDPHSGNRLQIIAQKGVGRTFEDPDCYIFCATDSIDEEAIVRLGYDSCIEIRAPSEFFRVIADHLADTANFWGAAYVRYTGRRVEHTHDIGIPPAFLKAERYSHQREVRAVWVIRQTQPIQPLVIEVKQASLVCCLRK